VRELVYLSKRKLRQFDLGRRGLGAHLKAVIKAPLGFGEVSVETETHRRDAPALETVIAALDRSDRAPLWFTEKVQPGQWVQFEAPMSYTTIRNAVIFLDIAERSTVYPSGGDLRLLLHGSYQHLVGSNLPLRISVDELSEQSAAHSEVDADALASVFNHFIRLIEYGSQLDINDFEPDRPIPFKNSIRAVGLGRVLPALSRHLHLPNTAAWMAGCARVTAVSRPPSGGRTILFATPLYVEHVSPPPLDY